MIELHVIGDVISAQELREFENCALYVKLSIVEQTLDGQGKVALSSSSSKTSVSVSAIVQV